MLRHLLLPVSSKDILVPLIIGNCLKYSTPGKVTPILRGKARKVSVFFPVLLVICVFFFITLGGCANMSANHMIMICSLGLVMHVLFKYLAGTNVACKRQINWIYKKS